MAFHAVVECKPLCTTRLHIVLPCICQYTVLIITHSQLLFNVFNSSLQSSGPLCGFILHCLNRLQEGCHISHHHLQQQIKAHNKQCVEASETKRWVLILPLQSSSAVACWGHREVCLQLPWWH